MIRIDSVTDLSGIIQMFCWAAVVYGIVYATFQSFFGDEIRRRIIVRIRPNAREIQQLQWEIRSKERWSHARAVGDEMTAPQRLTDEELASKQERLEALSNTSLYKRMAVYFMTCGFCQMFWITLILMLAYHRTDHILLSVASSFSYLVPCSIIVRVVTPPNQQDPNAKRPCPGGNCGG